MRCRTIEIDREIGVKSLPARFGPHVALAFSRLAHYATVMLLLWFGALAHLGWTWTVGVAFAAGALAYEQWLVKPTDLSKVNRAFFTVNGFVGIGLLLFAIDRSGLPRLPGMTAARRVPWVVGVTGASGTAYAAAVIRALLAADESLDLVVSRAARLTILDETGVAWHDDADSLRAWLSTGLDTDTSAQTASLDNVQFWSPGDLAAGPSSGSYRTRGMVVVPASMAAVAGIAIGLSKDLLQRAADVTLKERRPLVVVPRETPMTGATLRHLVALDEAGATVLPASPAFYGKPKTMQQLVDFVAGKILDVLGVDHDLFTRWDGRLGQRRSDSSALASTDSRERAASCRRRSRHAAVLGLRILESGGGRRACECCRCDRTPPSGSRSWDRPGTSWRPLRV